MLNLQDLLYCDKLPHRIPSILNTCSRARPEKEPQHCQSRVEAAGRIASTPEFFFLVFFFFSI